MSKKLLLMITILTMGSLSCMQAQNDVEVHLKGDLVTNYIWRGLNLGHVLVQPEMSVGRKGLSLSAWGSVGLSDKDDNSEIDLTLSYETGMPRWGLCPGGLTTTRSAVSASPTCRCVPRKISRLPNPSPCPCSDSSLPIPPASISILYLVSHLKHYKRYIYSE